MQNSNVKGALWGLLGFALYSVQDMLVKLLGGTYTAMQILFFGAILGLPVAMVLFRHDLRWQRLRVNQPGWVILRAVSSAGMVAFAFYAFSVLPFAQTYAILFAMPLLITVLSVPLLGESVHLPRWLAVLVGLVGVLIVLRPGQADLGLGHLAAVAAAFGGALVSVLTRKIGKSESSGVLLISSMLANLLLMGAALPFVYRPMPMTDLATMGAIALFSLFAMQGVIVAYRYGEAVVVAPMQYSQMLWAIFYGALLFDEWPDGATLLGAAVIIASGLFILYRESRVARAE